MTVSKMFYFTKTVMFMSKQLLLRVLYLQCQNMFKAKQQQKQTRIVLHCTPSWHLNFTAFAQTYDCRRIDDCQNGGTCGSDGTCSCTAPFTGYNCAHDTTSKENYLIFKSTFKVVSYRMFCPELLWFINSTKTCTTNIPAIVS